MYSIVKNIGENLAVRNNCVPLLCQIVVSTTTKYIRSLFNLGVSLSASAFRRCDCLATKGVRPLFYAYIKLLTTLCQTVLKVPARSRVRLLPPVLRRRNLSKLSQPVTSTRHSLTTSFIVAPLRRFLAGVSVSKKATSPLRRRTASRARSTPFVVSIETDSLWPSL